MGLFQLTFFQSEKGIVLGMYLFTPSNNLLFIAFHIISTLMKLDWHNQMTQIDAAMAEYDKKYRKRNKNLLIG